MYIAIINSEERQSMKTSLYILLFITTLFAQEQVFYLKSGDKITGTIIEETETAYKINTTFGMVTLNKEEIQPEEVEVFLKSGDRLQGVLLSQTDDTVTLQTSFGAIDIQTEDIERFDFKQKAGFSKDDSSGDDRWYFSDEQLMDIWFDPTGFTLKKGEFYLSGLSFAFGLKDRFQISSKFFSYFIGDFNLRSKLALLEKGDIKSRRSLSIGGHLHTRGLPNKYEFKEWDAFEEYWWDEDTGEEYRDTLVTHQEWVRVGSKLTENYWEGNWSDGDKIWGEVFAAYTISKLRAGGQGRINYTFGGSLIFYPGYDPLPRAYAALDVDIRKNIKAMAEVFYDPYWYMIFQEGDIVPLFFDLGFITNSLPLWGQKNEKLWIGIHFQSPRIAFYWKF